MFQLTVGPERKLFYSHEAVLSQSPVFERMCNGSFKEGVEQQIELPDDDANIFGCMLEYMYRGVFHDFETPTPDVRAAMLADLYILAEKYQLKGLKKLLITPLATIFDGDSNDECIGCFFDAARTIYENTPDSEVLFPKCFKKKVMQMLGYRNQLPCMEAQVKLCISAGDKLARDTFDACCTHTSTTHDTDNRLAEERAALDKGRLQKQRHLIQAKHDALEAKIGLLNSRISSFREYHGRHHLDCKICDPASR